MHGCRFPYTRLRSSLAREMDRVCEDQAPVIVTRKGSSSVVMISLDDYEALEERSYLLRSPKSTRRLLAPIMELGKAAAGLRGSLPSEVVFSEHACEDYLYWQKTDRRALRPPYQHAHQGRPALSFRGTRQA